MNSDEFLLQVVGRFEKQLKQTLHQLQSEQQRATNACLEKDQQVPHTSCLWGGHTSALSSFSRAPCTTLNKMLSYRRETTLLYEALKDGKQPSLHH